MKRLILGLMAFALIAAVLVFVVAPEGGRQYRLWRDACAVEAYRSAAGALDALDLGERMADARSYNGELRTIALRDAFAEAEDAAGAENAGAEPLDVAGSGVVAVLEIPKLGATLPVYRMLTQDALARGAAHLSGTSLPVGGEGTHVVLAGQGKARFGSLFDGLDRLIPGDCFYVQALQDKFVYEIEQVEAVAPEALEPLPVDPEADLCTLLTTQTRDGEERRLLVRARRIGRQQALLEDDTQALPGWAARMIFAAPLALAGLIVVALIEAARRAVRQRRLKRMKL